MRDCNRKCAKCNGSTSQDSKLVLYRFPKPGSFNKQRVLGWAKFCYPDKDWSNEEFHKKLYLSHKMLCSKHFPKRAFLQDHLQRDRLHRYSIPSESPQVMMPNSLAEETQISKNYGIPELIVSDHLQMDTLHRCSISSESPQALNSPAVDTENSQNYDTLELIIFAMKRILIVHGGAGDIPESRVQGKLDGVRTAVREGYKILLNNGSALDAVEAAVVSMEKDEYFNAGYGSVLNLAGEVEMEASIMSGKDLNVGAVTLIKDFLHPISIAHKVLTDSPHSLLGGEGAKEFALAKGFPTVPQESLISNNAKAALNDFLIHGEFGRTEIGVAEGGVGTVGAVAIDTTGNIAVATSTGGMSGKAIGRIGDTPQIGSGTYADDNIGGVSTTGHGESILKYCLAHSIVKLMESGMDATTATKDAVTGMTSRLKNTAGAITLSKHGDVGIYFSSNRMAWAYIDNDKLFYGIEHDQVLEDKI